MFPLKFYKDHMCVKRKKRQQSPLKGCPDGTTPHSHPFGYSNMESWLRHSGDIPPNLPLPGPLLLPVASDTARNSVAASREHTVLVCRVLRERALLPPYGNCPAMVHARVTSHGGGSNTARGKQVSMQTLVYLSLRSVV